MKASDIARGGASTLELAPTGDGGFGRRIPSLHEAVLAYSDLNDATVMRIGGHTWTVTGTADNHALALRRLIERDLPRVAWVAAALPGSSANPHSVVLEVREFPMEYLWSEKMDLGVDEKIVDSIKSKRRSLNSVEDVLGWLADKTIIPDSEGSCRVLLSDSPTPRAEQQGAFQLHGKGITVDVASDADKKWRVTRVTWGQRPKTNDERRPTYLARGRFKFIDYTVAGQFGGTAKALVDQMGRGGGGYLELWKEYSQLEWEAIVRSAQQFNWLQYSARSHLADGTWRFTLDDPSELDSRIRILEDGESVDIEAANRPPPELLEARGIESPGPGGEKRARIFAGECIGCDRRAGTLDLRPPPGRIDGDARPPRKGFLFISLSGDRKRVERR